MQTCLQPFLGHPTGAETLRYGIPPLGVPYYAVGISSLRAPSDVPLMGLPPLGAQILAYRLPSYELTRRLNPL